MLRSKKSQWWNVLAQSLSVHYIWHYLLLSRSLSEKNDTSANVPISNPSITLLPKSTLWRQYAETAIMKQSTDQSREAMGTESNDASSVVFEYVQYVQPDSVTLDFPPKYSLCKGLNHPATWDFNTRGRPHQHYS